jgi:hypothetical protein
MMLRRLAYNLRDQNWTAITIEFVLLVAGVFLGIQVANWNDARGARAEYLDALGRLDAEIETNLAILDELEPEQSMQEVVRGFEALRSCVDSPEHRTDVEAGLEQIRGTFGLHLHRRALDELTANPRLMSLQSEAERRRFTEMAFFFDVMLFEARFAEGHPLQNRIENNPILEVGDAQQVSFAYFGVDFSKTRRPLHLGVPIDEACKDDRLVKSFFTWEAWQANMPVATRKIRSELLSTRQWLRGDRP